MQPRESGIQYSGLEEAGMAAASGTIQSSCRDGISGRLCKLGTTVKVLSVLARPVFILGYTTGYYVHKCKQCAQEAHLGWLHSPWGVGWVCHLHVPLYEDPSTMLMAPEQALHPSSEEPGPWGPSVLSGHHPDSGTCPHTELPGGTHGTRLGPAWAGAAGHTQGRLSASPGPSEGGHPSKGPAGWGPPVGVPDSVALWLCRARPALRESAHAPGSGDPGLSGVGLASRPTWPLLHQAHRSRLSTSQDGVRPAPQVPCAPHGHSLVRGPGDARRPVLLKVSAGGHLRVTRGLREGHALLPYSSGPWESLAGPLGLAREQESEWTCSHLAHRDLYLASCLLCKGWSHL